MLIVQFIHPGKEFPVSDTNSEIRDDGKYDVRWSTEPSHYRRLVKHQGTYVNDADGVAQEGELAFWTEWEGPTVATKMDRVSGCVLARYSHRVQYPIVPQCAENAHGCGNQVSEACVEGDDYGLLNTDPCAFGRTFKYALCQQSEKGVLRHLNKDDLIAFVSRINGVYYLDTMFVVDSRKVDYRTGDSRVACSDEYRVLTLDRVSAGLNFTFYRGKRFTNLRNEPFSFAPARMCNSDLDIRDRCRLDIDAINRCANTDLFSSGLKQKFKVGKINQDLGLNVWNEIVRQVVAQGFVLGVHFDWPTR